MLGNNRFGQNWILNMNLYALEPIKNRHLIWFRYFKGHDPSQHTGTNIKNETINGQKMLEMFSLWIFLSTFFSSDSGHDYSLKIE